MSGTKVAAAVVIEVPAATMTMRRIVAESKLNARCLLVH